MGVVYLALDPILQRLAAIKVLSPHLSSDETVIARFINEARIAASLQHPNIVTVYEAGQDGDFVFMAMEYVEGQDLATLLRERGRLHPDEAIAILKAIASALDYAHQRGVIHRDVKPSNVLVSRDGVVKLMDFGIARVIGGERHTKTGVLVGTPEYMAPELWEGKEADKMADLYALGVMAYEMLTGEVPFTGATPVAIGYKHVHEEVPIERLERVVDRFVIEAIKLAMAKKPERRFANCMAFVRAMEGGMEISEREKQVMTVTSGQRKVEEADVLVNIQTIPKPSTAPSLLRSEEVNFQLIITLKGHNSLVSSVTFSPDGKFLASGSGDRTVKVWEVGSWTEVATLRGHNDWVRSVTFSPDGKFLASGSWDKTVKVWEVRSWGEVATLRGHRGWWAFGGVFSVAFSPDGKFLASGSADGTVKVWEVGSWREVATLKGYGDYVLSVSFSPDGKFLASGSNKTIRVWKVGVWGEITTFRGHDDWVRSVTFSPDGKFLASGGDDITVKVWEVGSWQKVATLRGHFGSVFSAAFSPDGKFLASGSLDKTVKVWEVGSWREVSTLKGHGDYVLSISLSPDGKFLASGSWDRTVKVWRVR
jgi:WD40 repeat protein